MLMYVRKYDFTGEKLDQDISFAMFYFAQAHDASVFWDFR